MSQHRVRIRGSFLSLFFLSLSFFSPHQNELSEWSRGLESVQKSSLAFLTPTWQYLCKSSRFTNRSDFPFSDREMHRIISSKRVSSHGIVNGPWLENPNSSSACTRSFLKMGWFRYVARTTNLLQPVPTQTATCPAGTSDGMRLADIRALLRQRLSIWRSLTMWRILAHFASPADIFLENSNFNGKQEKTELGLACALSCFCGFNCRR